MPQPYGRLATTATAAKTATRGVVASASTAVGRLVVEPVHDAHQVAGLVEVHGHEIDRLSFLRAAVHPAAQDLLGVHLGRRLVRGWSDPVVEEEQRRVRLATERPARVGA